MSCSQKLAHKRTSQGKPYNLDQATARNQGCNTAQCAPYKTDLVPIVIVPSPIPELSTANLTARFTVSLPAVPPSTADISAADSAGSAPSPTPSRTSVIPPRHELRESHRFLRGSLARCAAVGAVVMPKLQLQIHGPPPLGVRRLQID